MNDDRLFELLNTQDWKSIYPVLLTHTDCQIRKKLYWATKATHDLPKGYQPMDIVQRAISSVYFGKRKWDYDRIPDLLFYLKRVVDSLLSSLVESYENKERVVLEDEIDMEDGVPNDILEQFPNKNAFNPLDSLIEKDLWNYLWDDAEEDSVRQSILLAFEVDGLKEPSEIAKKFDLEIEEVNKGKKRLRRSIERYRDNQI